MSGYDSTLNYNLKKPWVDADFDAWGDHWNQNADAIDNLFQTMSNRAIVGPSPNSPGRGALWWDSVGGQLYVEYNDGNSTQYVSANSVIGLPITGGQLTGPLLLYGNATQPLEAVPLQQLNAATAGGPFLSLATGGTVSGLVSLGANQPNYWTASGSSGSPVLAVTGTGNAFANVKGLGSFGGLFGSSHGNHLATQDNGATIGNFLWITADAAGLPVTLAASDNTGGLRITSPTSVVYNWTYAGTAASRSNQPLHVGGDQISGVSANTTQFAINSITNSYKNFQSGQGTFGLQVQGIVDTGSWLRTNVPLSVGANQVGQPLLPVLWASGQSITVAGSLRISSKNLYMATTTGTTGATPPSGTGTVSDGGVTWLWCDSYANAHYQGAFNALATCNFNVGGVSGAAVGSNFGAVIGAGLQSGSTFYNQNVVLELDDFVNPGASVYRAATLQLVKISGQGLVWDWGVSFGAISSNRWRNPLLFQSAVDPNGYAIAFQDQGVGGLQTMAGALDMQMVTPTGNGSYGGGWFMRWPSGMLDQSGNLKLGYASLKQTANGIAIDSAQTKCTGIASIATGGSGWLTSMWAGDKNGNIVTVTASAGVVTAATLIVAGYSDTAPSGAQTFTAIGANGAITGPTGSATVPVPFTANLTYAGAASPALSMQPSGGSTAFGGPVTAPTAALGTNNTQVATTAYVLANAVPFTLQSGGTIDYNTISTSIGVHSYGGPVTTSNGPYATSKGTVISSYAANGNFGSQLFVGDTGSATDQGIWYRQANGSGVLATWYRVMTGAGGGFVGNVGFNSTAPIAKPTVTGAKGSNAALASLLTALAAYGLITDSSSA